MSVELRDLVDAENDTILIMAPDYNKEFIWLWQGGEHDTANRIDLTRRQLSEFRDLLNEILP